jgi:hypothetical protein
MLPNSTATRPKAHADLRQTPYILKDETREVQFLFSAGRTRAATASPGCPKSASSARATRPPTARTTTPPTPISATGRYVLAASRKAEAAVRAARPRARRAVPKSSPVRPASWSNSASRPTGRRAGQEARRHRDHERRQTRRHLNCAPGGGAALGLEFARRACRERLE